MMCHFVRNFRTGLLGVLFLTLIPFPVGAEPLPLSLSDAVMTTLNNNVGIAVEEFNSKIKKEAIGKSEAVFDPTLGIDLNVQEQTRPISSTFSAFGAKSRNLDHAWDLSLSQKLVTGADYTLSFNNARNQTNSQSALLNPNYSGELEFTLTQPLLKDAGIDNNKRDIYIAKNDVNITDFDFKNKVITVISDVENVYWDLVFSIEDLKVKQKSLERARDLERRVNAQVEVGTLAPLEILQAKSEVASREETLLSSEDLIGDNEDNLKNILNIRFDSAEGARNIMPLDHPSFNPKEIPDEPSLVKHAMEMRPDLLARKKELENKNIRVKYNENQIYPSVDLVGSLGLNGISGNQATSQRSIFTGDYGQSLSNMMSTNFFLWKFGIQLSYPLGNREAESNLTASRLEAAQALMDIKDLEKKITVEVREAVRQITTDIKRVQATRVAVKLAEEKLSAEEKKFEVGLSTSFNVLEFQEDLAQEQSNEIKAIIDYNKSRIKLRQVTATTLEKHNIQLKYEDAS
ncbi:MAG: hypothetical protein COV67_03965 [Nitrospinae bacterium CG11_big_fil_rev_8_21_14_0_20_56_8]|nr:MAG: hypothetical protein COV67_03965 [Nitrospinae bacterium CG11_big_fil_rev_8_21_14_0_20_56_8]